MKRVFRLMLVAALLAPLGVNAQDDTGGKKKRKSSGEKSSMHDKVTGQGYGIAGCGLGSVIFGAKPGMIQVIAATTNGTVYNQSFGITSGTLNCDIPEAGRQAAVFIEVNREILAKEAARGQGETLAGLAYILKCSDPAVFSTGLRDNHDRVFSPENDSFDATREILSTIENNEALKASCETLS